jgi:hypothetical protein
VGGRGVVRLGFLGGAATRAAFSLRFPELRQGSLGSGEVQGPLSAHFGATI